MENEIDEEIIETDESEENLINSDDSDNSDNSGLNRDNSQRANYRNNQRQGNNNRGRGVNNRDNLNKRSNRNNPQGNNSFNKRNTKSLNNRNGNPNNRLKDLLNKRKQRVLTNRNTNKTANNSGNNNGNNNHNNIPSNSFQTSETEGEGRFKIPVLVKVKIVIILLVIALFVMVIIALVSSIIGVFGRASASAPYKPSCETVKVLYCYDKNKNTRTPEDRWSNVPDDYENGDYFSENDCIIEEEEMEFEEYIARVVEGEVGILDNLEVFKAFAVASRTYALNNLNDCTIISSAKKQFAVNYSPGGDVRKAVEETYHEVLFKEDEKSESGVSLASPIEYDSFRCINMDSDYYYMAQPTLDDAGAEEGDQIPVEWVHKNVSHYVENGVVPCSPVGSKGIGHGRGMSQYGALYYIESNPDATYNDILKHYYGNRIVMFQCGDYDADAKEDEDINDNADEDVFDKIDETIEDEDKMEDLMNGEFESVYKACEILGKFD